MNLPTAITFFRIVLTAFFVLSTMLHTVMGHWIALTTFVIAAISDYFDGWLARKYKLVTNIGKLLDPVADKVLISTGFIYLSNLSLCPLWATIIVVAREFLVTGIRLLSVEAGIVIPADNYGKWKMGLQLTFVITCLVHIACSSVKCDFFILAWLDFLSQPEWLIYQISFWATLGMTIFSGWNYFRNYTLP